MSILVQVNFFATFRHLTKNNQLTLALDENSTILHLLKVICYKLPEIKDILVNEDYSLKEWNHILINGRNIKYLQGLNTVILDNDIISIFPPVAGGRE